MSRKRRIFDIDMPEDEAPAPAPAKPPAPAAGPAPEPRISSLDPDNPRARRGPMASAVRENAEALKTRAAAEAAIRAENDALAHEYVQARAEGLVLRRVALDAIETGKLARDRRGEDPEAMEELKASIRAIGLSNPIQLEETSTGFELIQGLRRLTAYRALLAETGAAQWAAIPAMVRHEGEEIEALYRRMVDENLVRKDISFAEMAALARDYGDDPKTPANGLDEAVNALYGSVAKQKRSYIRAFAELLFYLDEVLDFPQAIPRALGLAVRKRLGSDPAELYELKQALRGVHDEAGELAVLRDFAGETAGEAPAAARADQFPAGNREAATRPGRQARTTFEVTGPAGPAKITASNGRLEIRAGTDFSTIDRRRLEDALRRLMGDLDG